jgi:hypothetical protein
MNDIPKSSYSGQATALSQFSPEGAAQSRLLSQMANAAQKAADARIETISSRYAGQINAATRDAAAWKDLATDVGKATSDLSGHVGNLKSMRSRIDSMLGSVNKAGQRDVDGEYVNPAAYAKGFDALLKSLHESAVKGGKQPNMLGSDNASYSYRVGIHGQTNKVQGAYLGSEYSITDTEGKKWVADLSGGLLRRYDDYSGTQAAESGNFNDGIRLDSRSGSDLTFTIAPNTADPKQFTGTLETKGLGLVHSWYYDGLSTEEGRSRATAALNDAKEAINLEISRYELSLTTAKFYENRANLEAKGYREKASALNIESAQEIAKAQEELSRQYSAAQGVVAQALAQKVNYAKIFQSIGGSAFGNKLVNILT